MDQPLIIRCDAEQEMGTGHLMRCLALAIEWRQTHGNVVFVSHCSKSELWSRIVESGAELIPLGELAAHMHKLDSADDIVLYCKSGVRSTQALELLAGAGFRKMKNLRGGINTWAREVDTRLPIY